MWGVEHRVSPWIARQNGGNAERIASRAPLGPPLPRCPRPPCAAPCGWEGLTQNVAATCPWHIMPDGKLPAVNRPVRFNGWFHRGRRTWTGRRWRTRHPGRIREDTHLWSRREERETSRPIPPSAPWTVRAGGPGKAQRRKFPEARVACGNELSDARAGYRAVLYISGISSTISGISSTWSRESLAKARQTTTSSHRSHVP